VGQLVDARFAHLGLGRHDDFLAGDRRQHAVAANGTGKPGHGLHVGHFTAGQEPGERQNSFEFTAGAGAFGVAGRSDAKHEHRPTGVAPITSLA
jgi:hypothetical protein